MAAPDRNQKLAAYQSIMAHGGVAAADPHRLVLMLMDGAVERLTVARSCLERNQRGDLARKTRALTQCMHIVGELRASLDFAQGGELAQNLGDLYTYMQRQLLRGNAENSLSCINEVASLLNEIRSAWIAIGPQVRPAVAARTALSGR